MKKLLPMLLAIIAIECFAQSQPSDSIKGSSDLPKSPAAVTASSAPVKQARTASEATKDADQAAPAVKTGGSIGMTAGAPTIVKRKGSGTQVVTSTIGGDGVPPDEKTFAPPAAAASTSGAGNVQAQMPAQIRALLESPAFQQKLMAGAAAQGTRRELAAAADYREPRADGPLVVIPGVVEVVPIARGFLNRIVTPFENPRVYTVNQIDTTVDGNVVYVSTTADQPDTPIGLYIQDNTEGADDAAIALSLTPMDIPQRELRVKFGGRVGFAGGSKTAEKWETSQPYVTSIKEVLKALALNKLPQGYSLSSTDGVKVRCEMPGFGSRIGQVVDGHNFRVAVFAFRNITNVTRELTEQACYKKGVAAVAAWPTAVLEPNQETEVFVVTRVDTADIEESAPPRPSLISKQR